MIEVKQLLNHSPRNNRFYTIAIDGRGGAGKSHLVRYLQGIWRDFEFIDGDDYFEPVVGKPEWGAFNDKRFITDVINPIKSGNFFKYRPYRWHENPHIKERMISIGRGIVIHRCFSFDFDLDWDLKIWIETPKGICLKRGLLSESVPRERAIHVWRYIWQPQDDRYIKRIKPLETADVILDGTKPFPEQIT